MTQTNYNTIILGGSIGLTIVSGILFSWFTVFLMGLPGFVYFFGGYLKEKYQGQHDMKDPNGTILLSLSGLFLVPYLGLVLTLYFCIATVVMWVTKNDN